MSARRTSIRRSRVTAVCVRYTVRGACIRARKTLLRVRNAGRPRPTPRSCGRRVLTPLGCRSPPLRVSAAATGSVGVETIGGRCVELDAEEISLVSRAVAVVPSVTLPVVVERRSLLRSLSIYLPTAVFVTALRSRNRPFLLSFLLTPNGSLIFWDLGVCLIFQRTLIEKTEFAAM